MDSKALPVVTSSEELRIPWETLKSIISGKSVLDINEIHTKSKKEVLEFLRAYGIDPLNKDDASTLETIKLHAIEYINQVLLKSDDTKIPVSYTHLTLPTICSV